MRTRLSVATILIALSLLKACKDPPSRLHFDSNKDEANILPSESDSPVPLGTRKKKPLSLPPGEIPADQLAPKEYSIMDATCENAEAPRGLRQWRRLSNVEVVNTTEAVFGAIAGLNTSLVLDVPRHELYDNLMISSNHISAIRMKSYQNFAASIGEKIDLGKVLPCFSSGVACVKSAFIPLAEKAWRRPLTTAEATSFSDLHATLIKQKFTTEKAMRFLVEALAQSQPFLYRSELGVKQANGDYKLDSWEVASALSYGLSRRPPDNVLSELAKADKLQDLAAIKAQAERLMASPQGKNGMKDFGAMWLGSRLIQSSSSTSKQWTSNLRNTLMTEMDDLFLDSFFNAKSPLNNLLLAEAIPSQLNDTFPYGNKSEGNILKYAEAQRRGILGTAGFLAGGITDGHASPVKRGVYVLSRLLCVGFEPPPEVPPQKPALGDTNKDLYRKYESCSGVCHSTINQYGFPMENFNADASFVTKDGDAPIVTDNQIIIDGKTIMINSPEGIPMAIAGSKQLVECFARQAFRYSFGRYEKFPSAMIGAVKKPFISTKSSEADRCAAQTIAKAVEPSGDMKAGVIAAFTNEGFLLRGEGLGEENPTD